MNKKIFEELERLIISKENYEKFLETLKGKPYINRITLNKGMYQMYFDDDLIEVLIKYCEEKIKKLDEKISKFKLTKIID